jgi:hypothetical protein
MTEAEDNWRLDIIAYILEHRVPKDKAEREKVTRCSANYVIIGIELYQRSASNGDADMATMLMSMRGAWIGEDGVQQGFPSQVGGPRLIRFEPPRWRPKAIQVRAQFGVQE